MALKGFYCVETGDPVGFDYCLGVCGKCEDLPYLFAISKDLRIVVPQEFSTTTLEKPVFQTHLCRMYDYFIHPMDMAIVTFGTGMHRLIVEQAKEDLIEAGYDEFVFEKDLHFCTKIITERGEGVLTGTPDQYNRKTKTQTDFKSLKYWYDVKYLKEGRWDKQKKHVRQTNVYRRHALPDCEKIILWVFVKDITQDLREEGILPIEKFNVPLMPDAEVDQYVQDRMSAHLKAELTGYAPICTKEERFFNFKKNVYQNCAHYCSARFICPVNPYVGAKGKAERLVPSQPGTPQLQIEGKNDTTLPDPGSGV